MRLPPIARLVLAAALLGPSAAAAAPIPAPKLVLDPHRADAGDYKLDPHHASVTVKLSHMGLSLYTLRFDGISGHYTFDPKHPGATELAISIDPASVDTGDKSFDRIIADRYFETAKFPTITFASTAIYAAKNQGEVRGALSLHGMTKPIVLHVVYRGFTSMEGQPRMGFSAEASFKRSDFGVDAYVPLEGDEVKVLIEAEFIRAAKPSA